MLHSMRLSGHAGDEERKAVRYSPEDGDRKPSAPTPSRPLDEAENGSMVQDFDDLRRLGKDMERMKTGSQLEEDGLVNDPLQGE